MSESQINEPVKPIERLESAGETVSNILQQLSENTKITAPLRDTAKALLPDISLSGTLESSLPSQLTKLFDPERLGSMLSPAELAKTLRLLKDYAPNPAARPDQPAREPESARERGLAPAEPPQPNPADRTKPAEKEADKKEVDKGREKSGDGLQADDAPTKHPLGVRPGQGKPDGGDNDSKGKPKEVSLTPEQAQERSKATYGDIYKHFGPFFKKEEKEPGGVLDRLADKFKDFGKPQESPRSPYLSPSEQEYLKDQLIKARQELPAEEFSKLAHKLEKDTNGWFRVSENNGKVDKISFGYNGDVFRDSWTNNKAQRWNDRIGDSFFNAGSEGRSWNGDYEGLGRTLNAAKEQLTQNEFKALVKKISEGTGNFISHTETADGAIKEVKVGDRTVHDSDGNLLQTKSAEGLGREVRQDKQGRFFVKGPDGVEREFVDSGAYEHVPPRNWIHPDGAIKNETGRPILALADGALRVVPPGHHNTGDYDAIITNSNYQPVVLPDGRILMPAQVPPDVTVFKFGGLTTAVVRASDDKTYVSGTDYEVKPISDFTNPVTKDQPARPKQKA